MYCPQEPEPGARKRISSLLLDPWFNVVFVLCDGSVTLHDADTLSILTTITAAKGGHCMAINAHTYPAYEAPTVVTHRLCVAVKKRILVFNYAKSDPTVVTTLKDPLLMPQAVQTLGVPSPLQHVCQVLYTDMLFAPAPAMYLPLRFPPGGYGNRHLERFY